MIVCTGCNRKMKVVRVGVPFVETIVNDAPYKLWAGDQLECQDCGYSVVMTGPTQKPIAEHYQPEFHRQISGVRLKAKDWNVE